MADFETMPLGTMKLLEEIGRTFREYEASHKAQAIRAGEGTQVFQDRTLKARRNGDLAARVEKLLAEKREGVYIA